ALCVPNSSPAATTEAISSVLILIMVFLPNERKPLLCGKDGPDHRSFKRLKSLSQKSGRLSLCRTSVGTPRSQPAPPRGRLIYCARFPILPGSTPPHPT